MHQQSARRALSAATFIRSAEVAAILQVSPSPISRWAQASRLPCQRTLAGHRRSPAAMHQVAASPVQEVRDQ